MSYWDSLNQQIIRIPPRPYPNYPGWTELDCGCCGGLEWGGEVPRDCRTCKGSGSLARHDATGTLAMYPSGPLLGRETVRADR